MAIFENPVFVSALLGWLSAQLIKTIIDVITRKRLGGMILESLLWRTGGMPSSHSSLVTSISVSVAISEGIGSTLFAVTTFYGILVIRDSLGVRRSSGQQAQVLNNLSKVFKEKDFGNFEQVKEIHGHTPLEVGVGILLGAAVATVVALTWA